MNMSDIKDKTASMLIIMSDIESEITSAEPALMFFSEQKYFMITAGVAKITSYGLTNRLSVQTQIENFNSK